MGATLLKMQRGFVLHCLDICKLDYVINDGIISSKVCCGQVVMLSLFCKVHAVVSEKTIQKKNPMYFS